MPPVRVSSLMGGGSVFRALFAVADVFEKPVRGERVPPEPDGPKVPLGIGSYYLPSTGISTGQRASPLQGKFVASACLILMKQTQRDGEPNEGKVSRRFRLVAWCG